MPLFRYTPPDPSTPESREFLPGEIYEMPVEQAAAAYCMVPVVDYTLSSTVYGHAPQQLEQPTPQKRGPGRPKKVTP